MPSVHIIASAFLAGMIGISAASASSVSAPAPTPAAPTPAARTTVDPQLNIAITNGRTSAKEGDRLTYAIKIHNLGPDDAKELQVTQSLPAGLTLVSADAGGAATGDRVTWTITVKAGEESTLTTVGQVGKTPDELLRLATVACAATKGGTKPLVCATHSDLLPAGAVGPRSDNSTSYWIWYVTGAAVLLLSGLGGYLLYRRRRRTAPEPDGAGAPVKATALTGD